MKSKPRESAVDWLSSLQEVSAAPRLQSRSKDLDIPNLDRELHTPDALDRWSVTSTQLAYRHRGRVTFVELLALPIQALGSGADTPNSQLSSTSESVKWDVVQDALNIWAPEGVRLTALCRVLTVEQLQYWCPDATRFLLEHALPGGATFQHALSLPVGPAQGGEGSGLGFLFLTARSISGWPRRLIGPRLQDARLKAILQFSLSPQFPNPIHVGFVQAVSEGMVQGFRMWAASGTNFSNWHKWDIELDHNDADRWWVQLGSLDSASVPIRVPLRAHLLGSTGLHHIVNLLETETDHHSEKRQ